MDYIGEQEMEVEALAAILMDDIEVYDGTVPEGWTTNQVYRVKLRPTEEEEEKLDRRIALDLLFSYTEQYPDEAPLLRLQSSAGLADEDVAQVQSLVEGEVENNIGMAMIFNLVEVAREWLRDKVNVGGMQGMSPEEQQKALEEAEEKKRVEQRSHGIPVTVESFMKWKEAFDEEMKANAAKENRGKQDEKSQRLTGKQFFLAHEGEDMDEGVEDEEEGMGVEEEELNFNDDDDEGLADDYLANHAN